MSSYRHRIGKIAPEIYILSWTCDRHYADSRLRFPVRYGRETDEKGARKFAKKWNVPMPEDLET